MNRIHAGLLLGLVLIATACSPSTTQEILDATEGVETRAELEKVLGEPDQRNKVGPLETWTYRATDGNVRFLITVDRVRLAAALDDD